MIYLFIGLFCFFIKGGGWIISVIVWSIGLIKLVGNTTENLMSSGKQWEYAYRNSLKSWGGTDTYCDRQARKFANYFCKDENKYYIPTMEEQDKIAIKYGCNPKEKNLDYNNMGKIFYNKYYSSGVGIYGEPIKPYTPIKIDIARKENMSMETIEKILQYSDKIAEDNYNKRCEEWNKYHI